MGKKNTSRRANTAHKSQQQSAIEAYAQTARGLFRDSQVDRAIQVMKQAVALAPKSAQLHQQLGQWLIKQKQAAEGTSYLKKSLEIDPDFLPALIELGQEHAKKNLFDEALPLLRRALELGPENPSAHLVYGTLLQKQGKLPEAVEHFRRALEYRLEHPTKATPPKKKEDFDKPETEALMWDTLTVLAKAGVHAFASYGTLLGLVREGGLLPFDKDIDFGLPHCEMERACLCLEKNGWIETKAIRLTNPKAFFHPLKGVSLDLSGFVVDKATGETFTGFWIDNIPYEWNRNTKYITINLQKGLSPSGQPIWALQSPEKWLETIYGDWEVPDPNFDTVIAAKNLCRFSLLTQCYTFSRIFSKWQDGSLIKALALIQHTQRHLPDDELIQRVKSHIDAVLTKKQYALSPHAEPSPCNSE